MLNFTWWRVLILSCVILVLVFLYRCYLNWYPEDSPQYNTTAQDPNIWYIYAKNCQYPNRRYLVRDKRQLRFVDPSQYELNPLLLEWRREPTEDGFFRLYSGSHTQRWYVQTPDKGLYSQVTQNKTKAALLSCDELLDSINEWCSTVDDQPSENTSAEEIIRFSRYR